MLLYTLIFCSMLVSRSTLFTPASLKGNNLTGHSNVSKFGDTRVHCVNTTLTCNTDDRIIY